MVKIIFLDVDGVLNSEEFHTSERGQHISAVAQKNYSIKEARGEEPSYRDIYIDHIDPKAVKVLQTIIDKTDAKIVVSSSWRTGGTYTALLAILKELKFTGEIIDVTGRGCIQCYSGNEILNWIKQNSGLIGVEWYSQYKNYIIMDDDSDMLYWQKDNFLHTNWKTGLLESHIDEVVKILNQGE